MPPLTEKHIKDLVSPAPYWAEIIDTSDVVLITGRKRHGKSALTYCLLEELAAQYDKPACCWGVPYNKIPFFPDKFQHFQHLTDIETFYDSVIALDEVHRCFSSRTAMKKENITFSDMLTFSGQNNQIILLSTLNNGLIDINTFRITNPILIYKRVGNLQAASERSIVRKYTLQAMEAWKEIPRGNKDTPERSMEARLSYVICDGYVGWMENPLPLWWSQDASEMHARKGRLVEKIRGEAFKYQEEYQKYLHERLALMGKGINELYQLRKSYPIEQFYLEHIQPKLGKN